MCDKGLDMTDKIEMDVDTDSQVTYSTDHSSEVEVFFTSRI